MTNEELLLARDIFSNPNKFGLNRREHAVLQGLYVAGLSHKELGKGMNNGFGLEGGISRTRVKQLQREALRKVRLFIGQDDAPAPQWWLPTR